MSTVGIAGPRWVAALLLPAVLAAGCAGQPDPTALPPPPATVTELPATGAHEVKLDYVVADLYGRYGPVFGEMFSQAYQLPADTGWPAIAAHYDAALDGWQADPRFPPDRRSFRSRTWVDGKRVFAAALVEAAPGTKVLVTVANQPLDWLAPPRSPSS